MGLDTDVLQPDITTDALPMVLILQALARMCGRYAWM